MKRKSWLKRNWLPLTITLIYVAVVSLVTWQMIEVAASEPVPYNPLPPQFWPPMSLLTLAVIVGIAALIIALLRPPEKKRRARLR